MINFYHNGMVRQSLHDCRQRYDAAASEWFNQHLRPCRLEPFADVRNEPCLSAGIPEGTPLWNGSDVDSRES